VFGVAERVFGFVFDFVARQNKPELISGRDNTKVPT
jgi:hypothetical protein